jgi:hypothetical protein
MIMPETANTQKLEKILDVDKGKDGLQLPKNFEDTFKKRENRDLLVKAVNNKFENSDSIKQNKEAIIGACKTEINSWGESLPTDAGKVAVLYLYNALNGKTLYKEDLPTAFDNFKKNKTEGTGTEGKDAKNTVATPTTGTEGKDAKNTVATPTTGTEGKDVKNTVATPTTGTEKTTSAPTLKDQVTSIPALKDSEAVNKILNSINTLESQKNTLGSQLNTKIATLNTDNETLTTKQDQSKKLDEQIKDTKKIDDKLARRTALDGLNTQKGTLNNEIRSLTTKISNNKSEIDNLVIDMNTTTQEITDNKDNLLVKLEPTQRTYEKNIKTTKDNITKLETTINGKYSDSQKVTLKPYFEKWESQLKEQKTNLTQLNQSLTGINTVVNSLKSNPTAPEKNLTNNKTETTKPAVATTEIKENNEQVNTIS